MTDSVMHDVFLYKARYIEGCAQQSAPTSLDSRLSTRNQQAQHLHFLRPSSNQLSIDLFKKTMFHANALKFALVGAASLASVSFARPVEVEARAVALPDLPVSLPVLPALPIALPDLPV